jgi:biopolymer transport protein ExbB
MKQSIFITVLLVVALAISSYLYWGIFGTAQDKTLMHNIYQGGPLVVLLLTLTIMDITFIFERILSLRKANGRGPIPKFLRTVEENLQKGDVEAAINACDAQRGSCANIIRTALERYKTVSQSSKIEAEKQMAEVQHAIEEGMMLEVPLLEKNLIALSTIASIATMVGLLGTVIGMIRAFQALARQGAPDAVQLSTGISEALINTAGGLIAAIIGIVAYNYFVNKVDSFTYMIDEASFNVVQILSEKK